MLSNVQSMLSKLLVKYLHGELFENIENKYLNLYHPSELAKS